MKLDSNSQLRGASLLLLLVPFFLLVVTINTSTCLASPVARPVPAEEKAVVEVEVEVEAENDDGTVAPKAAALDGVDNEDVSEEHTAGAVVSGDIKKNEDDVDSAEAASYFVQRFAMSPRMLRMASDSDEDGGGDGDADVGGEVEEMIQGRVGEIGTIISVIKIATELGEAVLPVVIKEVQSSPIGNLVIGVIGGINDGASGASGDTIHAGMPIPIKVVRRAVQGFLRAHSLH